MIVNGPLLAKFNSTDRDAGGLRYRLVFIDIRKVLVVQETRNGTRVVLEPGVPVDLSDPYDAVIERLQAVAEKAASA